uniref:Zinc knuckle CX2CX4HX4C domain-containing protein n=1 Tax=Quercus lobata TaxID=97700 RepID=A0A7N2M1R9_QUELO
MAVEIDVAMGLGLWVLDSCLQIRIEELTRTWNSLTLSDRECSNFRIKKEQAKTEYILAAKFLTKRALNIDAIAKTFTPLWRSRNGFKIKKESDHVVLFSFDDKNEMEKIMAAEPWSSDKNLMVLQRFQTRKIVEQLCEAIGKVNVGTEEAETEGANFIRVRVTLDITQPLSRGHVVALDSGKELWVHFRYERLPSLCFWCGCLTHEDRDCELWIASEGSLLPESQQYGPWLKAAPFVASRKYVIKVPGIFTSKTRSSEGKHEVATEKHKGAKAVPVVVVRSGKQVPAIIRLEKESITPENIRPEMESFEVPNEGNIEPVFQEVYIHDSRQSTEEKVMEDVIAQQAGAAVKKESGMSFE